MITKWHKVLGHPSRWDGKLDVNIPPWLIPDSNSTTKTKRDSHSGQLADDHKVLSHPSRWDGKLNVNIPSGPIPDNNSTSKVVVINA
jgi:hypothetical protein